MKRTLLLAVALVCLCATASTAAAASKYTDRYVTVKIAGSQKTTWQAAPVADPGCENKPTGSHGSGIETIEWSQSRVLKGQLSGSGTNWGLMLTDKKGMPTSNIPIAGTIDRQGSATDVVCGKEIPDRTGPCVGKKQFATDAQLSFLTGRRFTLDDPHVTLTDEDGLYPDCNWIWNGMTVRTGAVLLNVGVGKFDPKRLANGRSSVSLKTHDEQLCENHDARPGVQCKTVTDWRITFYPVKKKRR